MNSLIKPALFNVTLLFTILLMTIAWPKENRQHEFQPDPSCYVDVATLAFVFEHIDDVGWTLHFKEIVPTKIGGVATRTGTDAILSIPVSLLSENDGSCHTFGNFIVCDTEQRLFDSHTAFESLQLENHFLGKTTSGWLIAIRSEQFQFVKVAYDNIPIPMGAELNGQRELAMTT